MPAAKALRWARRVPNAVVAAYELPLGPLGLLLHRLVVRRQLDAIFDYRQARIAALLVPTPSSP
jgi:hypothetical protein